MILFYYSMLFLFAGEFFAELALVALRSWISLQIPTWDEYTTNL